MKRSAILLMACIAFGNVALGERFQIRGSLINYSPSGAACDTFGYNEVSWDKGRGLEIQGVFWPNDSLWGFGVSIGKATWDLDDYEDVYGGLGGYIYGDFLEGDADLRIWGLSVFRPLFSDDAANKKLSGEFEGGIRFVSVDSNIDGLTGIGDQYGPDMVWYQTLEIDDSIICLLALALRYTASETVSFFAQVGIQLDFDKGSVDNKVVDLGTFDAGETELDALFGKVGLSISL